MRNEGKDNQEEKRRQLSRKGACQSQEGKRQCQQDGGEMRQKGLGDLEGKRTRLEKANTRDIISCHLSFLEVLSNSSLVL